MFINLWSPLLTTSASSRARQPLSRVNLRWLDRLKNDEIHKKYDAFKSKIYKVLEHLQKTFWNDPAEFASV